MLCGCLSDIYQLSIHNKGRFGFTLQPTELLCFGGQNPVTKEEQTEEPPPKPCADKKDYKAIFTKYIFVGVDGKEDYDVIDM